MMIRGAAHEIDSSRIKLPYEVSLTMDEDHSLDAIAQAQIETSIGLSYRLQYGEDLRVYGVKSAPSHGSQMLQLADVIAGAVNRRLNHKGDRGYKDDMADLIIERLDIKIDPTDLPDIDSSAALSI